jgi:hypothetical protein
MQEILAAARSQSSPQRTEISGTLLNEWWALVIDPEHILSEWRAIVEGWNGAIELQRKSPLTNDAIPAKQGLAFHARLLDHPAIFLSK